MHNRLAVLAMLSFISALLLITISVYAQDPCLKGTPYRGCRACGKARRTHENPQGRISKQTKSLNVQKNRDEKATNPKVLTVQTIRDRQPPANNGFAPKEQVEIIGFVAGLDDGGDKESCNCGRDDLRDLHINVVAAPEEVGDLTRYVVVEITPRWQKTFGLNDSDYKAMKETVRLKLAGKWVRFRGWILYDIIHRKESKSTAAPTTPTCTGHFPEPITPCIWRATPWEVHPVTSFQILPGPPS